MSAGGPGVGAVWRALRSVQSPPEFAPEPWTEQRQVRPGLMADRYLPARPNGQTVVIVHGGAFVIGDRRMKPARFFASELSRRGFQCVSLDYRLIFRGGRLDEALEDVEGGLRLGHALADGGRVTVLGLSAGATLSILAAARAHPAVSQVVGAYGLWDFTTLTGGLARPLPRLLCRTGDRAEWARRSPLNNLGPQRTLLLHGTADALVPYAQAEALLAARRAAGLETELVTLPDAPHGFFNHVDAYTTVGLDAVLRFLDAA